MAFAKTCGVQLVGLTGLEPVTLRLSSACSNQLSYRPIEVIHCSQTQLSFENFAHGSGSLPILESTMVELGRFELPTYSLQSYRSTN